MSVVPPTPSAQGLECLALRVVASSPDDVAAARSAFAEELRVGGGSPEPVATVEQVLADGVPARLYRPLDGDDGAALVWFHGGAWMVGDVEAHDALARFLANRANCAVLSVDYRLAPEHRYPAAVNDAWAATLWASTRFERIAVGGDSSGGNLAAAVAHRARDHGLSLRLQLLVYPVLDYRPDSREYTEYRERYRGFAGRPEWGAESQEGIRRIWERYVPEERRRHETDASPLRAPSCEGLAPAVIITAEHDILRAEDEAYAARLTEAAVPTQILSYPGQIHGFYPMFARLADGKDAVERSAAALHTAFSDDAVRDVGE